MTSNTIDNTLSVIGKQVYSALERVYDPELHMPITRLGMVKAVRADDKNVSILVHVTSPACPAIDKIKQRVEDVAASVCPEHKITVDMGVMSHEERQKLKETLNLRKRENPFRTASTRIIAVTSGKGGVGKSTIVSNLAVGLVRAGFSVSVIDADVYGFSIPRMFGVDEGFTPRRDDGMIVPAEQFSVKLISIGMFMRQRGPIAWRGPLLHRTINQFLCDVDFGNPDVLLVDMPPGTGDAAITIAQLLPKSEVLVVTTPQIVAADVAIRSGQFALSVKQKIIGVVENMSSCPSLDIFGSGGGKFVAEFLNKQYREILQKRTLAGLGDVENGASGAEGAANDGVMGDTEGFDAASRMNKEKIGNSDDDAIELITCIPLDVDIRRSGDEGVPLLAKQEHKTAPGYIAFEELYQKIALKLKKPIVDN